MKTGNKRRFRNKKLIGILLLIPLCGLAGYLVISKKNDQKAMHPVLISGVQNSFIVSTFYVGIQEGFFDQQGIKPKLDLSYTNGMATLEAVASGKFDVGLCSETPFARMAPEKENLRLIASINSATGHLGIIARKDNGIQLPVDLYGKRIGVTMGSNGEYFLNLFSLFHHMEIDRLNTIDVKPNQMVNKIVSGELDAIVTWNPQKLEAIMQLGNNATVLDTSGLYTPFFLVVSNEKFIQEHPEYIQKLINALHITSEYITDHPHVSQKIVAKYFNIEDELLVKQNALYDFRVSLDQGLILSLEDQARWAMNNGLIKVRKMPNFINYIYSKAVSTANPEGLTLSEPEK